MLNFSISRPLDKTIDDDVSVKSDGESGVASTSTVSMWLCIFTEHPDLIYTHAEHFMDQ
jgi:hypothetical protein